MPKRKAPANPSPPRTALAVPPVLPPSVEEAYRRKCMELKQRTKEVEDVNDATQLRLARLKRQVDKLRVERAFLYEQLAKRTSTNVEDSDGSPSPPPTPKEKPLRIKRGHRKPSILQSFEANPVAGSTFINQNLATLSPSSDTFSHHLEHKDGHPKDSPAARFHAGAATNGLSKSPKKPRTAFELYADKMRAEIRSKLEKQEQDQEGTPAAPANVEEELEQSWKDLPGAEKEDFKNRERDELEKYQEAKVKYEAEQDKKEEQAAAASPKSGAGKVDEDPESGSKSASGDKDVKDDPDDQDADANAKSSGLREASKQASQDEDVEMNEDSE